MEVTLTPEFRSTLAIENLVLREDTNTDFEAGGLKLMVSTVSSNILVTSDIEKPIERLMVASRTSARLLQLSQHYPHVSERQLMQLFPLFWTDDIEFSMCWGIPGTSHIGYLFESGIRASAEPLPISQWISQHDSRLMKRRRSLFEQTARERKFLLSVLLKEPTEISCIHVCIKTNANDISIVNG